MIGHHALRRRKDGDTETIADLRDGLDRNVNATARLRNADDFADDGRTLEILQLDVELGLAVLVVDLAVVADVTFGLQNIQNAGAKLGSRRGNRALLAAERVTDTGQHITDWIIDRHRMPPLPAGLDKAWDQATVTKLAKRDTRHPEFAVVSTRTTRNLTTVADASLRRVARKGSKLKLRLEALFNRLALVHDDGLQCATLRSIAIDQLPARLVLLDCANLCHSIAFL